MPIFENSKGEEWVGEKFESRMRILPREEQATAIIRHPITIKIFFDFLLVKVASLSTFLLYEERK